MMLRPILALLFFAASGFVFGQANTPPEIKVILPKTAKAGSIVKATVQLTFADGLHGYQNPPSEEYQIPVRLEMQAKGFTLVKSDYPKGVMLPIGGDPKPCAVYEGVVKIPVTIKVGAKRGPATVTLVVSYQQCNDQSCYPPAKVEGSAKLTVVK
jgi:DsbC/DsbD-like thiol-disulfide interchange protein